jgi:putative endonuclease
VFTDFFLLIMAKHNILGQKGEDLAANFLLKNGYNILERNWKSGRKEIDIIALRNNKIAFIEVKTRTGFDLETSIEAVDLAKQQLLIDAANEYIEIKEVENDISFDIIVILQNKTSFKIYHYKDAFYPLIN